MKILYAPLTNIMKSWIKILLGLGLGVAAGYVLGRPVDFLAKAGSAFIGLLKMLVPLLVFASLVTGVCHIGDPKKLGRIGLFTLGFYVISTLLSITIGLGIVQVVQPGKHLYLSSQLYAGDAKAHFDVAQFLCQLIPKNPFAAFVEGNILQVIVFATLFAYALLVAKEKGKSALSLIESLNEVMGVLTRLVMRLAPYAIFALMATAVGALGSKILYPLLLLLGCMLLGCLLQIGCVFVIAIRYVAKLEVIPFFRGMKEAILVGFTTSSSCATLPISLECAREKLGISPDVSGFVLSLGATVNMNGTAIWQVIAALFIAQGYGIDLNWFQIATLYFVALISAVGTAGVPGSGLILLSIVLNALGLPLESIGLLAGIDRIRDMMATVVNILGDAVAAVYVAKKEDKIDIAQYRAAV